MTGNILLEVFLLHARILRDFFVSSPEKDDASARDYFEDSSAWEREAGSLCTKLQTERTRINKKLAHLTHSRLTEKEQWELKGLMRELVEAKETFLNSLAPVQRKWFTESVPGSRR